MNKMYTLQVVTADTLLQLKTELCADTIAALKTASKTMVKRYPSVIGKEYVITQYTLLNGQATGSTKTIKRGIIKG